MVSRFPPFLSLSFFLVFFFFFFFFSFFLSFFFFFFSFFLSLFLFLFLDFAISIQNNANNYILTCTYFNVYAEKASYMGPSNETEKCSNPFAEVFIKLFLGVIYFAGAVSKVVVAAIFGRPWLGSTMQAYVMDAMWSRPHSSFLVRALQRFLLQRWYLCTILAVCGTQDGFKPAAVSRRTWPNQKDNKKYLLKQRSGLAFEFAWLPMVMFGGRLGSVPWLRPFHGGAKRSATFGGKNPCRSTEVLAGAIAFSFHLGVDLLQAAVRLSAKSTKG